MKPGLIYQLQCTYRTRPDFQGQFSIWLRSGKGKELGSANVNFNTPATNGEWRTVTVRVLPEVETCNIYLTITTGIGEVQIRECTLAPVADIGE